MDYHGSDCTCIHSPSSVSLLHLFFQLFHETSDLKLQTCTLTHLLTAAILDVLFSSLSAYFSLPFPVSFFRWFIPLNSHSTIPATLRSEYLLMNEQQPFVCGEEHKHLVETGSFPLSDMFHHSTLLCPYGFTVTHRGQRGCLSVLLIFSLAPLLIC